MPSKSLCSICDRSQLLVHPARCCPLQRCRWQRACGSSAWRRGRLTKRSTGGRRRLTMRRQREMNYIRKYKRSKANNLARVSFKSFFCILLCLFSHDSVDACKQNTSGVLFAYFRTMALTCASKIPAGFFLIKVKRLAMSARHQSAPLHL